LASYYYLGLEATEAQLRNFILHINICECSVTVVSSPWLFQLRVRVPVAELQLARQFGVQESKNNSGAKYLRDGWTGCTLFYLHTRNTYRFYKSTEIISEVWFRLQVTLAQNILNLAACISRKGAFKHQHAPHRCFSKMSASSF
jgi:hypothetical protein